MVEFLNKHKTTSISLGILMSFFMIFFNAITFGLWLGLMFCLLGGMIDAFIWREEKDKPKMRDLKDKFDMIWLVSFPSLFFGYLVFGSMISEMNMLKQFILFIGYSFGASYLWDMAYSYIKTGTLFSTETMIWWFYIKDYIQIDLSTPEKVKRAHLVRVFIQLIAIYLHCLWS